MDFELRLVKERYFGLWDFFSIVTSIFSRFCDCNIYLWKKKMSPWIKSNMKLMLMAATNLCLHRHCMEAFRMLSPSCLLVNT